jgi:hypothetical protein
VIHKALDREDWDTVVPAILSIGRLVELGRVPEVLRALLEWSEPQDSSPMVSKTLAIFVTVACHPPADLADEHAGILRPTPSAVRRPLLLTLAHEHLGDLAELWARALARKPAQSYALEGLRECLDTYTDDDREALLGMTDVLLNVAARPGRHRDRLDWYLREWADDAERPSSSAAHIRDALERVK